MTRFCLCLLLVFFVQNSFAQKIANAKNNKNPIGVFDSGTGGLTVLEALLSLDAFNNVTGKPGTDGKLDFDGEYFQYLADQANMPYGNYASENKTTLLKEHILKNMQFLLQTKYHAQKQNNWIVQNKPNVKMLVIACNTATAYALSDIKQYLLQNNLPVPCIGVIDAGTKAALAYQKTNKGTIGVFATAGTVASNGYALTIKKMATENNMDEPSIVSQGGVGLAESIDRDWSYFIDTATKTRTGYKGPSYTNEANKIDTVLLDIYKFNSQYNQLLCEYNIDGACKDVQLNSPANYVRFHLVTLLEKMRNQNIALPLNTLILGCTHYPYMKDTISNVLLELYNYQKQGEFRYRKYLAEKVELIDPSVETAKEAYVALRENKLQNSLNKLSNSKFIISVPNTSLNEIVLQPDGWFTYSYKYGRVVAANKKYVRYVNFNTSNVSPATYQRFKTALPFVYKQLQLSVKGL
jgi:glutamate racemase